MISYHCEDIRNIETDAGKEVAGGVHHEYRVLEQTEVHHLLQDGRPPGVRPAAEKAGAAVRLRDPRQTGLLAVQHGATVFVRISPGQTLALVILSTLSDSCTCTQAG